MSNSKRIVKDILNLENISDVCDAGVTRIGFTPKYREGVNYFKERLLEIGLDIKEDSIGNVYGVLKGKNENLPSIVAGSHLDTVKSAGSYDGIAGTICALEVARMLRENHIELNHNFEVMGIIEEEGTRFSRVLLGSSFVTGKLGESDMDIITDDEGKTLREVLSKYQIENPVGAYRDSNEVMAFLELHDEQGPLLEDRGIDIGIVENIVAISRLDITVNGFAGHAGTVPMPLRSDPMLGSSRLIDEILTYVTKNYPYIATATVGKFDLIPGSSNSIASKAVFSLDVRAGDLKIVDEILNFVEKKATEIEKNSNVKVGLDVKSRQDSTKMNEEIKDIYRSNCEKLGYSYINMNSGAGHDSMIFAEHFKTAMFFVPCKDGVTHNPEEFVSEEALEKGANLLYETVLELDKM